MNRRTLAGIPLAAVLTGLAACSADGGSAQPAAAPAAETDSPSPNRTESRDPEATSAEPAPEARDEPEPPPEAEAEIPKPEAGTPESESAAPETPPGTGETEPDEEEQQEQAPPAEAAPDLASFTGLSASDGVFSMRINEAYVDDDGMVTDGMGTTDRAADGSEYVVFNVQITNESSAPAYFDWGGSYAYDTAGNQYADDFEAALAACDTYCADDLNPGAEAETDVIFEMPEARGIASLELRSDPYASSGSPAVIEP